MPSQWINHVKEFSKKNNMKYGECLSNPQCKAEYQKIKGSGMEGGKIHVGKVFKKIDNGLKKANTKIKDAVVSKTTGSILQGVKKTGQVASTGLNYIKKSGLAESIPMGEELIDITRQGIKQQNRGINYLQDKRQDIIDKRKARAMNGGSFRTVNGGSFNFQGGSFKFQGGTLPKNENYGKSTTLGSMSRQNETYDAVYGNTNGIDRFSQTFYPNPYDTKSIRQAMFGVK